MSLDPLGLGRKVATRGGRIAQGFAQFLLRGKTADLAVGVVIGAAIGGLVSSFVSRVLTPLIGALFGSNTSFENRVVHIRGEIVYYGDFLNNLLSFLLICAVVYFAIIIPMNKATTNAFFQEPPDPAMRKCPECQSDIPKTAKRCMYCTQPVEPDEPSLTAP
ncbi:MAG: MscL family protein [Candidatus Eremiobacteraeota bacterium]|nr:MscL family protein [Candidatus Eremiobacteraeota bacterium]